MSGQIDLPDIGVKVVVDDSALARTGSTAGRTGQQIQSGLGAGKKASDALESGLTGLAAQFGISLPPEVKKSASALLSLVSDSSTTRAEVAALSGGVKGLASDLGVGVPPQAEKSAAALKGLATSGLAANAAVGVASGAVVVIEGDLAKAGDTAGGTGEKIQSAFETGKKASETLKSGLEGVKTGGEDAAAGIGLATAAAIGGVAILSGLVVAAKAGVDSYLSLADKVENYQRVTGLSAEESSREVQAFQMLDVSSETASAAIYKLSKNIEAAPAKLQALGVEIAKDADGNVQLGKTLENVADAYVHASTAQQKNLILQTAFGKSGRDMIPILEQGSAGLRELESAVGLVMSQEDIDRAREYKIHVQEAKGAWDGFTASIGEKVVPALDDSVEAMNRANYVQQKMDEYQQQHGNTTEYNRAATEKLAKQYGAEFDAAQKASTAAQIHADKLQAEADAAKKVTDTLNAEIAALEGAASAEQALINANIDTKESQDKITEAQVRARDANRQVAEARAAYNQAVRDHGKNSAEARAALDALTLAQIQARKAADDITKAQEDQYQAYLKAGEAARKLQAEQDKANDVTGLQAAKLETEKLIDTLQAEADALAPNSPLRKRLQEYIDKLKSEVPKEVSTEYVLKITTQEIVAEAKQHGHFAAGGRPPLDKISEVGEQGIEIFTPDQPDHPQLLIGTKGPQPFVPPEPGVITPHGSEPPEREPAAAAGRPYAVRREETPAEALQVVAPSAAQPPAVQTVSRALDSSSPPSTAGRLPASLLGLQLRPSAGASPTPSYLPVASNPTPAVLPPAAPQLASPIPTSAQPSAPTNASPARASRASAASLPTALSQPSVAQTNAPARLPATPASMTAPVRPATPIAVAGSPATGGSTPTRRPIEISSGLPAPAINTSQPGSRPAALPAAPSQAAASAAVPHVPVWASAPAAAARSSSGLDFAGVSQQLAAVAAQLESRNLSDGNPAMAHVTVDQPIVLNDEVIGRIVDRRIAQFLHDTGSV